MHTREVAAYPYPPGAKGTLAVSVSTGDRLGTVQRDITLRYMSGAKSITQRVRISFSVRAEGKLAAEPDTLYLGAHPRGTQVTAVVEIRELQSADRPTRILSVSAPGWLSADVVRRGGNERRWQLRLAGRVPYREGVACDLIRVTTDHPKFPTLEIPVLIRGESTIVAQPRSVVSVLRIGQECQPVEVVLRQAGGLAWKVEDVELDGLRSEDIVLQGPDRQIRPEHILRIAGKQGDSRHPRVIRGALVVRARVGRQAEVVRVPMLFIWRE